MAATSLETIPTTSADRQAALTDAVGKMRVRTVRSNDRMLLYVSAVAGVMGIGLILLAWAGAAQTPRLFEQIPYMISGGLLGLALVFVGGFLYFAYWLTELARDQRVQTDTLTESLARIERLLAGGGVLDGGDGAAFAPAAASAPAAAAPAGVADGDFVATAKGSQFHRPDCPVVAGRAGVRRVAGDEKGMSPCRICEPLG